MMGEGEERQLIDRGEPRKGSGKPVKNDWQADPFEDITEQEVVDVLGIPFVFQHMLVRDMKRLEKQARNPRTGDVDGARLFRSFYDTVVLGRADDTGNLVPGTKTDYDSLIDRVANAFDVAITSFLGYGGG